MEAEIGCQFLLMCRVSQLHRNVNAMILICNTLKCSRHWRNVFQLEEYWDGIIFSGCRWWWKEVGYWRHFCKENSQPWSFPILSFSGHSKVRLSSTALCFGYELLSDHGLKINGPTDNGVKYPTSSEIILSFRSSLSQICSLSNGEITQ